MKKFIYAGIALIVVVAAVLIIGLSNLGPIIKTAVNKYGPAMTKTDLRVHDVSISILSGEAKLKDFYLGMTDFGGRKSFRDVKHYKRRKRWLT